jgi:hypothetical protein
MENENEVTVVVENPTAETVASMEANTQQAQAYCERDIAVAEIEAAAVIAVAEAHADGGADRLAEVIARLDALATDNAALRADLGELRAVLESAADDVEDELRADLIAESEPAAVVVVDDGNTLESGEVPASVEHAEAHEPPPPEAAPEHQRKRHFVRL